MAIWREDVKSALESIGGQGSLNEIYEAVRTVRKEPLPRTWKDIIRRELEYNSSDSDSYQQRFDLFYSVGGLGEGMWGLRTDEPTTPIASDLGDVSPGRVETKVYRILRDSKLARALKKLHKDKCQICGVTIELRGGRAYSEAHHIQPLGKDHNGPDIAANIVVVCPNHHAALDFGAFEISTDTFRAVVGHLVDEKFLSYHNEHIATDD